MSSRMSKYFDDNASEKNSRYQKNSDLYKEISKSELDNYNIKSNATIIGDHKNEIDVEKIKQILDTRYNQMPQRKSIRIEEEVVKEEPKEITKEYDINVVLEKAKEKKEDNYDEERMRKLRDTQYDILNNLNIDKKEEKEEDEKDNLRQLIDTITINESKNSNENVALDLLSDLKGDDNTEVLDGITEEVEERSKEFDTNMINSFYTTTNALKESDFEDVDDFSEDIKDGSKFVKIVVIIAVLALLIGIGIIIKTMYFS